MEIERVEGTVAVFEHAQTIGTLDAWRPKQVIDPYDNEADDLDDAYSAYSRRLSKVRLPGGIGDNRRDRAASARRRAAPRAARPPASTFRRCGAFA